MKKRVFSLLLALVLTLSAAAIPASAAGSFSDVSDKKTAQNVEILKLLGVIEGNGAGQFNPYAQLTRAEFSKMVVMLIGKGNEAMRYRTVTIFPDVRASHWAAGYINLAVRQTEPKLLAGTPDGTFQPERAITYGEAVTILMRVLGYADKDTGGVWPDSYIDLAKSAGVSNGVELAGNAAITRAQAAQLFVNVLYADTKDGKNYIDRGDKYTLVSVDGGTGELRLIDEKGVIVTKTLENPSSASVLIGLKGYLVERTNGKVRTFLPENGETVGTISNAAVIVSADRSTVGFSDLAGGRTDYRIYKDGREISASALKKYDVATYNASTNVINICDTRVSVYYEGCDPKPAEPTVITVLGGTRLNVLPSAQSSVAKFKPGQQMTILLTADGQVAGADDSGARGNAIGIVTDGKVQMLCGMTLIELVCKSETVTNGVVRISASGKDKIYLSEASGGSVSGDLIVSERTIGSKKLADNAMIFENGKLVALSSFTNDRVAREQISYARTNASGEIDLVVINRSTGERYGRVFWESAANQIPVNDASGRKPTDEGWEPTYRTEYDESLGVDEGGTKTKTFAMKYNVKTGDYVAFKINQGGTGFSQMIKLTELSKVSFSSWIGDNAVTFGSRTYEVPSDVLCFNKDNGEWITLAQAKTYADAANLYVKDGVVRVIEVRS
ncbi:MAG: S-layer homology domain-containing protein [Oscillospiraceae bacterium]|nr:S-layer homology domain-containing protein [Oscillospiraceae bacterium]